MSKLRLTAFSSLALALAGTASAQSEEGSLYQVSIKTELVGMPIQLPEQTVEVCGPKDHSSEKMVPHADDCTVADFEVVGKTSRYTLVCTGDTQLTAKGEFEQLGPDTYRGTMNMVGTSGGQSIEMNTRFRGKRIGACEYTPPAGV